LLEFLAFVTALPMLVGVIATRAIGAVRHRLLSIPLGEPIIFRVLFC